MASISRTVHAVTPTMAAASDVAPGSSRWCHAYSASPPVNRSLPASTSRRTF
jgi:hypothetical protein